MTGPESHSKARVQFECIHLLSRILKRVKGLTSLCLYLVLCDPAFCFEGKHLISERPKGKQSKLISGSLRKNPVVVRMILTAYKHGQMSIPEWPKSMALCGVMGMIDHLSVGPRVKIFKYFIFLKDNTSP